jgi:hypothetical protein
VSEHAVHVSNKDLDETIRKLSNMGFTVISVEDHVDLHSTIIYV